MTFVTTVIIGAGQSGLAMSKHLTDRSIDHVLLERGEVAQLVADGTLGLASPADAELAKPPSRLCL